MPQCRIAGDANGCLLMDLTSVVSLYIVVLSLHSNVGSVISGRHVSNKTVMQHVLGKENFSTETFHKQCGHL